MQVTLHLYKGWLFRTFCTPRLVAVQRGGERALHLLRNRLGRHCQARRHRRPLQDRLAGADLRRHEAGQGHWQWRRQEGRQRGEIRRRCARFFIP